jgi:hypothetical protein
MRIADVARGWHGRVKCAGIPVRVTRGLKPWPRSLGLETLASDRRAKLFARLEVWQRPSGGSTWLTVGQDWFNRTYVQCIDY